MMQTNIEERVKTCISFQFSMDAGEIRNDACLVADLGADSLDLIEIVMCIEDDFDIEISDEGAEKIATVQQAIDYVTSKV